MTTKKILGNRGEDIAAEYIRSLSYQLIARNYRLGRLEFDLITRQGKEYVFIEVKTRQASLNDKHDSFLSARQYQILKRAINIYGRKNHIASDNIRLDLIIVLMDSREKSAKIIHYKNIF